MHIMWRVKLCKIVNKLQTRAKYAASLLLLLLLSGNQLREAAASLACKLKAGGKQPCTRLCVVASVWHLQRMGWKTVSWKWVQQGSSEENDRKVVNHSGVWWPDYERQKFLSIKYRAVQTLTCTVKAQPVRRIIQRHLVLPASLLSRINRTNSDPPPRSGR